MRNWPNMRTEKYAQPNPGDGHVYRNEPDGWYLIPRDGVTLRVIASIGLGWDHVSVSLPNRCPTWDEFVRELFFRDDDGDRSTRRFHGLKR